LDAEPHPARRRLAAWLGQGWRYLLVGGLAWLIDFLTFLALYAGVGLVWAQTAARVAGALVGFAGHKYFVFADRRSAPRHLGRQALLYVLLWGVSYGLSVAGLLWLVRDLDLRPVLAKLLVEAVIIGFNFITMKRLIFGSERG
jgi:putative flippase GtrA